MANWEKDEVILFWIWIGFAVVIFYTGFILIMIKNYVGGVHSGRIKTNELILKNEEEMVVRIVSVQENERHRIAEELHDNIVSQLNLIRLSNLYQEDRGKLNQKIKQSMQAVRNTSHNLAPPDLQTISLIELVADYSEELKKELEIDYSYSANFQNEISEEVKLDLFRIFQEITNNTLKHAKATRLNIQIRTTLDYVTVLICDNGIGFENENKRGFGLRNIETRAKRLQANYKLKSEVNQGTKFIIHLTINKK